MQIHIAAEFITDLPQNCRFMKSEALMKPDARLIFAANARDQAMDLGLAGVDFQSLHQCAANSALTVAFGHDNGVFHGSGIANAAAKLRISGKSEHLARPFCNPKSVPAALARCNQFGDIARRFFRSN